MTVFFLFFIFALDFIDISVILCYNKNSCMCNYFYCMRGIIMPSLSKDINVISRCAHAYRTDALNSCGLSACHYFYIFNICANPGISQDGLAKRLYLNKSSVARALSQLEADGFVERRQSDSDKRVTCVFPTERAKEILPFVKKTAKAWNEFLLSCLTPDEQNALMSSLEKICKKAQSYVNEEMTPKDIEKEDEADN